MCQETTISRTHLLRYLLPQHGTVACKAGENSFESQCLQLIAHHSPSLLPNLSKEEAMLFNQGDTSNSRRPEPGYSQAQSVCTVRNKLVSTVVHTH